MKKNRGLKYVFCGLILAGGCFSLTACSNAISIKSIEKTDTSGLVDTYTIYYSDGSTYEFEITNGANGVNGKNGINGKDGKDISIRDIYDEYIREYGDITFEDFLDKYLDYMVSDNSLAINSSLRSCLQIYSEFTTTTNYYYNTKDYVTVNAIERSGGSAVVYKVDTDYTYILTNYHVVYNKSANADSEGGIAYKIIGYVYGSEGSVVATNTKDDNGYDIYDYGNTAIPLEYIGGAVEYDIAILRTPTSTIKAINDGVVSVEFASEYHVGETAIAIGNPEGKGISASEGIISVDSEFISLNIDGAARSYRSVRIDTAIYAGSSGGGLFNTKGELIGITNAGNSSDESINYAIPVSIVKPVVENIMYNYSGTRTTVHKVTFGVTVTVNNTKYQYDQDTGYGRVIEDIVVTNIADGSIASTLGLQAGDILKSIGINNKTYLLDRYFELGDISLMVRNGDKLSIGYNRDGVAKTTGEYNIKSEDIK